MEATAVDRSLEKTSYGFMRELPLAFDSAVERTREALQEQGFGVLSEIRMDEKLKEKLGVHFRKYVILGACNPPLAYKAVQHDINIGLLLPCNVIVYEATDATRSVVASVDAETMMSIVGDSPEMSSVAAEANQRLKDAVASI